MLNIISSSTLHGMLPVSRYSHFLVFYVYHSCYGEFNEIIILMKCKIHHYLQLDVTNELVYCFQKCLAKHFKYTWTCVRSSARECKGFKCFVKSL